LESCEIIGNARFFFRNEIRYTNDFLRYLLEACRLQSPSSLIVKTNSLMHIPSNALILRDDIRLSVFVLNIKRKKGRRKNNTDIFICLHLSPRLTPLASYLKNYPPHFASNSLIDEKKNITFVNKGNSHVELRKITIIIFIYHSVQHQIYSGFIWRERPFHKYMKIAA